MTDEYEGKPAKELLSAIEYHIENGTLTRKEWEVLKPKGNKLFKRDPSSPLQERVDFSQGVTAYSKILETSITAQEALEYVATYYGKSSEWVEEVKNTKFYVANDIVKEHNTHEVQKAMRKDGTFSRHLKSSETPNEQLRELHKSKKLHDTLNTLKSNTKEQKEDITGLKIKSSLLEKDLGTVFETLEITKISRDERVLLLRKEGFSIKEIAKVLDISTRTTERIIARVPPNLEESPPHP